MRIEIEERLKSGSRAELLGSEDLTAVASVESEMIAGARDYFRANGFKEIVVPHVSTAAGACENFDTLFPVDFFGKTMYLSQTGQLFLEAFMSRLEKTCCIGPSFRAEPTVDSRHLVEFPLLEIEVAKIGLEGLREHVQAIFGSMISSVTENCREELDYLGVEQDWLEWLRPPYKTMTYAEAVERLAHLGVEWGDDLKAEHEAALVKQNGEKPLFVTHYPAHIKFFNMKTNRDDPRVVNSMDLLMPYSGESVGAAEREDDAKILEKRLSESEMINLLVQRMLDTEQGYENMTKGRVKEEAMKRFDWYMQLVAKYPIQHSGCGIGGNRVTQALLKTNDIRAATAYPVNRISIL